MSALKMWFSALQTKRLKKAVFLYDDQVLKQFLVGDSRSNQIILCGNLIYASLDKGAAPNEKEAVAQPARLRDSRDYKGKKGSWNLWIARSALRPEVLKRGAIFVAQDQYIAYGQKQSRNHPGRLMVVGGAAGRAETNIEIYLFEGGTLIGIEERMLNASQDSLSSSGGVELLELIERRIEELTGSFSGDLRVHIAAPLADYSAIRAASAAINAQYVGREPFERLIQPALNIPQDTSAQALSVQIKNWALPAALALAGAGVGYYLVDQSMGRYDQAVIAFKRAQAAQSPDMDNATLSLLQAKGVFLDELQERRDYPYFTAMTQVLKAAGQVPGIYISQVRLLGHPDSRSAALKTAAARGLDGGVPDLQMVVHIPLPDRFEGSLRDHSRTALEQISRSLQGASNDYRFTAFSHQRVRLPDEKFYNMFEVRVTRTERPADETGEEWQ
ncbi:MAG: hypothetical protein IBX50_05990 [Marinospirillum sp.]|uniref:hypothetical protein n=1 Tax=Marinospirillum sp. TaxID=2183934 RepID=UPI0019D92A3D|nr:hypothetical protein [Marinospirillum sp.]MBE0506257.1 hypothetical protein [Marinospirillum sp.]